MKYTKNNSGKQKTRMRNILFNQPFSKSVSTNFAKAFHQLIAKQFPKSCKLHKIFNRNAVKVSYSCMSNMSKIIKGNNKKVTLKPTDQELKYNCRKKAECPMEGNWLVNNVVYKCDVKRPLPQKVYLRLVEGEWEIRFYNGKLSIKWKKYSNKATL